MKISKILWGLLIVGCGVVLLLSALGIGLEYGPMRIISSALLLGVTVASIVKRHLFFSFMPAAILVYLWRQPLGFEEANLWLLLLAAALMGIGLSLLFHRRHWPHFGHKGHHHVKFTSDATRDIPQDTDSMGENEWISINSSFSEQTKYIKADNLKRVDISGNFSSVKAYFDQCQISPEGLVIQISGNFCGVVLHVPRSWFFQNDIHAFAADVSIGHADPDQREHTVKLVGSLNFAELKIKYV